ncbi:MAG: formate--tetrahydrofolate ligase, partial [Clostridia bacterium]|nr:formate--tetrahydrofolate ligase [Clostridia bacterium]
MSYKTDIEIAQECQMKHIREIAAAAHVDEKYVEQYGNYKAKIDLNLLEESDRPDGK